jgi:hypothetical protein
MVGCGQERCAARAARSEIGYCAVDSRSWERASVAVKQVLSGPRTSERVERALIPRRNKRGVAAVLVLCALGSAVIGVVAAAARETVDKIAESYDGKALRLRVDLYEPEPGGAQAPYLDEKGWHHNDPKRTVILRTGDPVEVTGVFNYGDHGIFLEISRAEKWKGGTPRPRVRVRFMAATGPEKPDVQTTEIHALIDRVLAENP